MHPECYVLITSRIENLKVDQTEYNSEVQVHKKRTSILESRTSIRERGRKWAAKVEEEEEQQQEEDANAMEMGKAGIE